MLIRGDGMAYSMSVNQTLTSIENVQQSGKGQTVLCPAHDDHNASLSINLGDDGRILLHCHAGCPVKTIVQVIGLEMSDLFPNKKISAPQINSRITKTYDYHDKSGKNLFQVVRLEPKGFYQRRPKTGGGWHNNLDGITPVLYRLPDLLKHPELPVYVGEGEKDADGLVELGIQTATTSPAGAGKWRQEYSESIRGRDAVLFPDNDPTGLKHATDVANSLYAAGCTVKVVSLPNLPPKGDSSDWIAAGGTLEALLELVKYTKVWEPTDPAEDLGENSDIDAWLMGDAHLNSEQVIQLCSILPSFEYDRHREAIAKKLGVRVSTLDGELKANKKIDFSGNPQGAAIEWPDCDPWPEAVDGAKLLTELTETFNRYIVLPRGGAETIALWIVHTHAHEASSISPYLALISPVKRCGKTRSLELLTALVPKPILASNISPSALFRAVDAWHPTLIIDEADTFIGRSEELIGMLNSGHTRGTAYVIRSVPVGDGFEPRQFSTWSAKVFASIGHLRGTLHDRSLVVSMRRKSPREKVETFRLDRMGDFESLRRKIARWVADHFDDIKNTDPLMPPGLHDRSRDNWRGLLGICDIAGGPWPELGRKAASIISGVGEDFDDSTKTQLLKDIQFAFKEKVFQDAVPTAKILEFLNDLEHQPWCEWKNGKPMSARSLSTLLNPFGIKPKQIRFGKKSLKGYEFANFADAFRRYLPVQTETRETASINSDFQSVLFETQDEHVSVEAIHKSNNNKCVSLVSDITQELGWSSINPILRDPVSCGACEHFTPDPMNPPQGTGRCALGEESGKPHWPMTLRFCKKFAAKTAIADNGTIQSQPGIAN